MLAGFGTLLLLFALGVPMAVGVMLTRFAGTRPQDRVLTSTPADEGLSYRTVFLQTRDGVRISAWLLPGREPVRCSVVLAHGLFRSRRELLAHGAWLVRNGCRALLLDLRRHGGSGGERTTLGYLERFDVLAGADYLGQVFPDEPLVLHGVSMGGAAAAGAGVATALRPAGVVLDSVFQSAPAVVDRYADLFLGLPPFPAGDLTLAGMRLSAGVSPRDLDVEMLSRQLGARGVPVLVIAGDADRRAPVSGQAAVFRANGLSASRMITIEGASHGRPCLEDPAACRAAVRDFLPAPLDPPAAPNGANPARAPLTLFYDPDP